MIHEEAIRHTTAELEAFPEVVDQLGWREGLIRAALSARGLDPSTLAAVVGRGGLVKPLESGTYRVDEAMCADLRRGLQGSHASNLGGLLAWSIGGSYNVPAYVVDPPAIDELDPVARISGLPELPRRSLVHALNLKAVARRAACELGKPYAELNLVLAHLGGGISICPQRRGRMVDVNNANESGPLAPERAGTLPASALVKLAYLGKYSERELLQRVAGRGGLMAHLGTNDAREVEARIAQGDAHAELVYRAMAYGIAKEIGAMATVLCGEVDAVVITGGLAHSALLVGWVTERVRFIAPVLVYPGEEELRSLAAGALRVLRGEEQARTYA